jgi:tRNA(adenine34) deaminase
MSCHSDCVSPIVRLPSRRAFIAGMASIAVLPGIASAQDAGATAAVDERFMRIALEEAKKADFPFGAVIVRDSIVIARGGNLGRTNRDPTAHGEMVAIRRAVAEHGGAVLRGTTIYTTGEPCAMCMGAILWSRFDRLVYAASVEQLSTVINQIMVSSADLAAKAPFAPIAITGGVLAEEAMQLFRR